VPLLMPDNSASTTISPGPATGVSSSMISTSKGPLMMMDFMMNLLGTL